MLQEIGYRWVYLSLTHSFSVISENIIANHTLPKTRFFIAQTVWV